MRISRRRLLAYALGFAATGWLPRRAASRSESSESLGAWPGSTRSAQRVGESYVRAFPEERDASRLASAIGGLSSAIASEDVRIRARARIRADFAAGRTVEIEGWILSRTEARICALVALRASGPAG